MRKDDLKTGMAVRLRNGDIYFVIDNWDLINNKKGAVLINREAYLLTECFNNNLTHQYKKSLDIVLVDTDTDILEGYRPLDGMEHRFTNTNSHLVAINCSPKDEDLTEEEMEALCDLDIMGINHKVCPCYQCKYYNKDCPHDEQGCNMDTLYFKYEYNEEV